MKKLVIFGSTGATGKETVIEALSKGYFVTAIARNPDSLVIQNPQLTVIKGNVHEPSSFEKEIAGADVVISCLGESASTKATNIYSTGVLNIISAMEKFSVKRLICISAGALDVNDQMGFPINFITAVVLQKILKKPYENMRLMEKVIKEKYLDWTIVRPPMLTNGKFNGKYRVSVGGHIRKPFSISRANLAHYLVHIISLEDTYKKIVEVAN